jgi:hypothetical protein
MYKDSYGSDKPEAEGNSDVYHNRAVYMFDRKGELLEALTHKPNTFLIRLVDRRKGTIFIFERYYLPLLQGRIPLYFP